MNADIQKLIEEVKLVPLILDASASVEQIAEYAASLPDPDLVDFLEGLDVRVITRVGELNPSIPSRLSNYIATLERPEQDDNRFERIYHEDD